MDRQDAAFDARRRPDLAAAASRHLLDRRPQAADPRPQERQPAGSGAREAGRRSRRRNRRRGRGEGARRRRPHFGPRRWHRRVAADVAEACRRPVGTRPCRDPADADRERLARAHRRPDRRAVEDRPRCRHRGAARGRRVRFRNRAARRVGLRHDARVPPRHLPCWRRDAEPRVAQAVQRQARVRRELLRVHRRPKCANTLPSWVFAASRKPSGKSSFSTPPMRSRTGRPAASTSRRSCTRRPTSTSRAAISPAKTTGLEKALDNTLDRAVRRCAQRRAHR